jgi:mono/diheme cytochrome c family protein
VVVDRDRATTRDAETREVLLEEELEEEGKKKKKRTPIFWIVLALIVLGALGAGGMVAAQTLFRTEAPLPLEREMADLAKRFVMVPGEYADRRIPNRLAGTPQQRAALVERGKKLFLEGDVVARGDGAMECALCHGQAGLGDSDLGKNMYPPASNLHSQSVQSKSDGQLYWLIAHGINLAGMPAYGKGFGPTSEREDRRGGPYTEDEVWSLVAYIRSFADEPTR